MSVFEFTIEGDPRGYYASGKVPNRKRLNAYVAFKRHAQISARFAGLELPLTASKGAQLEITTRAYYRTGVHCDPENTHKGTVDALFWHPETGKRGNDKHVGGHFSPPMYDPERPRVEVEIRWLALTK